MKKFKILYTLLIIISLVSCKKEKPKVNPELASIDFLRGDVILCAGDTFGNVSFSLNCDYSVRETFDLAVSLLHSFEYVEAEKAFVKVLDADPECAMAYWGVAMSIYHAAWFPPNKKDLEKASKVLALAKNLPKDAKEKAYLDAINSYYKDWQTVPHSKRAKDYEKHMEQLYLNDTADTEAAIFYALALFSTRDRIGKAYTNERKAGKILESLFPDKPNHPGIAHYLIHNYDNPELANMALNAARSYADIAPASAHAQHMPSHIFTRLGLWNESIDSNLKSMYAAQCYAEETNASGSIGGEIHAMDYLIYAYLQKGDTDNANIIYQNLLKIDTLANTSGPYNYSAIPSRMALENKNWKLAASLEPIKSNVVWNEHPWELALTYFAKALGNANINDVTLAKADLEKLETLHKTLEEKEEKFKALQVLVQIKATKAWIALAQKENEKALTFMTEAANTEDQIGKHPQTPGELLPARELLGDLLLKLDKPKEALEAYELSLKDRPNRFNSIYGAAYAAKKLKNSEKAKNYFNQLLELTKDVKSTRKEIAEAKLYVKNQA